MTIENENTETEVDDNVSRVMDEDQQSQMSDMLSNLGLSSDNDDDTSEEDVSDGADEKDKKDLEGEEEEEESVSTDEGIEDEEDEGDAEEGEDEEDLDESDESEDEEAEEVDEKDLTPGEQNKLLLKHIQELESGTHSNLTVKPDDSINDDSEDNTESNNVSDEIKSFIGDMNIDDVVSDPEKFHQVLMNVANYSASKQNEKVLKQLPGVVLKMVKHQTQVNAVVDDFYEVNDDLLEVKGTVGRIGNGIAAEHPDWTMVEIFTEAGKVTRKVLGMPAKKKTLVSRRQLNSRTNKKKVRNPGFANKSKGGKTRGSKNKNVNKNSLSNQIGDMIKTEV